MHIAWNENVHVHVWGMYQPCTLCMNVQQKFVRTKNGDANMHAWIESKDVNSHVHKTYGKKTFMHRNVWWSWTKWLLKLSNPHQKLKTSDNSSQNSPTSQIVKIRSMLLWNVTRIHLKCDTHTLEMKNRLSLTSICFSKFTVNMMQYQMLVTATHYTL
jgi:hypothetical protein